MKESLAFSVLESTDAPTITHDDKLLLRGQKSAVGLRVDWRDCTNIKHENGEPIVVNYVLPGVGDKLADVLDPARWSELEPMRRAMYRPQFLRGLELGSGASVLLKNNQFDLRLTSLFDDMGSRYRSALDAMVGLTNRGVLRYEPRTEPSERNTREALRNRLRRSVKPTEYEHDVLIQGELGRAIWEALRGSDKVSHVTEGTIYIKGYQKYKGQQSAVKVYDVGMREGLDAGRWYKLETTLYKGYFKAQGIGVRELTEQPEIQARLVDRLTADIAGVVKLLPGGTVEMLQAELGLNGGRSDRAHTEIAKTILERPRTLTDRVRDIERRMDAIEKRTERLEQKGDEQNRI